MTEYEVKFEWLNPLSRRCEVLYDFVKAESKQSACDRIRWIHGEHLVFLSVDEFTG